MNLDIEPRVTYDGDIILKVALEISAKGPDQNVAGQNLPTFFSRKVETRLRLRDGESNLLAGLLRENERKTLKGFPGISSIPILRDLFASNDREIVQTDIVMLLTPHVVRAHSMTAKDFLPLFVGTQGNLGLAGPPPLIQAPGQGAAQPAGPPGAAAPRRLWPDPRHRARFPRRRPRGRPDAGRPARDAGGCRAAGHAGPGPRGAADDAGPAGAGPRRAGRRRRSRRLTRSASS